MRQILRNEAKHMTRKKEYATLVIKHACLHVIEFFRKIILSHWFRFSATK